MLFLDKVSESPLFKNMSYSEVEKTLKCLLVKKTSYKKNDIIWLAGTSTQYMGLLVSGSVRVYKDSPDGSAVTIGNVASPNFLGEIGVWSGIEHYPISVQANEDCEVFFLESSRVTLLCRYTCLFHKRIIETMLFTIAKKAFMLDQKVEMLSKRTIRERLLCFFNMQAGNANKFTLPYSREEMARHLCVNRSALSDELSKMRDEGLIRYRRNEFELLWR